MAKNVNRTVRLREKRWEKLEDKVWALSQKKGRIINRGDVVDAIMYKYIDEITLKDLEEAEKDRKTST